MKDAGNDVEIKNKSSRNKSSSLKTNSKFQKEIPLSSPDEENQTRKNNRKSYKLKKSTTKVITKQMTKLKGSNQNKRIIKKDDSRNHEAVEGTNEEDDESPVMYYEDSLSIVSVGIFNPNDQWKLIWDLTGMFFVLYIAIVAPYRVAFEAKSEGGTKVFEVIQDIYFMLDLLISFNTGVVEEGRLIVDRKEAIFIYIKFWFWVDLLSTIPLSLILSPEEYFQINPTGNGLGLSVIIV